MKKILATILTLVLALTMSVVVFTACGGDNGGGNDDPGQTVKPGGDPTEKDVDVTISDSKLVLDLTGKNLYVTSIGQAADFDSVENIIKLKAPNGLGLTEGTDYTSNKTLAAANVSDGDTVIIVAGVSSKGMGAAGIDAASELNRAKAFAAKSASINIIMIQAGGEARRGAESDPIFAELGKVAKVSLVIESADKDNKFSNEWCKDTPLYLYSRTSKMTASLKFILGK